MGKYLLEESGDLENNNITIESFTSPCGQWTLKVWIEDNKIIDRVWTESFGSEEVDDFYSRHIEHDL